MVEDIEIKYIDDESLWMDYKKTIEFLKYVVEKTDKKVLCKPRVKVLEDGLIVGIITETNQFIKLSEPAQDMPGDELEEIESVEYNNADRISLMDQKIDKKRVKKIKQIRLENNFYDVFRNTIRLLLRQSKNCERRKEIEEIIKAPYILYYAKIEKIIKLLKTITKGHISFSDKHVEDLIENVDEITSCYMNNEEECKSKNLFCLRRHDNCEFIIPKINLINNENNEKIYFEQIADEFIRYSRIKIIYVSTQYFSFFFKNKL